MIKVWGRKTSSNVQVVLWCLAELGIEFDRTDAGIHYGVVNTAEYLSMNPNATVPTIIDGDNPPMWESAAINRYLARRYASAPFWPDDPIDQARVDQWAEWSKLNVGLNFSVPIFWKVVRTPKAQQDPQAIASAVARLNQILQIAEDRLAAHQYLTGDDFTLADVMFGHLLYRFYTIDIERAKLAGLERYYQDLQSRPAYREHVMVNYDELRAKD